MDPYTVLGVTRSDSIDTIESAYHRLLRACHPDLHQSGTPEEISAAEATTVRLNEAIAVIRSTHRPPPPMTDQDIAWTFQTEPDTDWFGNPLGKNRNRADHVDCPFCTLRFTDPIVFRSHLAHEHHQAEVYPGATPPRAESRLANWSMHWMAWIPAPAFWLFVILVVYWAIVYAALGEGVVAFVAVWVGVAWYVAMLRLAYKYRRRSI